MSDLPRSPHEPKTWRKRAASSSSAVNARDQGHRRAPGFHPWLAVAMELEILLRVESKTTGSGIHEFRAKPVFRESFLIEFGRRELRGTLLTPSEPWPHQFAP